MSALLNLTLPFITFGFQVTDSYHQGFWGDLQAPSAELLQTFSIRVDVLQKFVYCFGVLVTAYIDVHG